MFLRIRNDGPRIVSTNFWNLPEAAAGSLLSTNAATFRLLVPDSQRGSLADMTTAPIAVVSRGCWTAVGRSDGIEILFDDGTDSPFALWLSVESCDRLPPPRTRDGRSL